MRIATMAAALGVALAAPAAAADHEWELWLHPSVSKGLGQRDFLEFEAQQRFRGGPADDTSVARLWYGRDLSDDVTVMVGLHRGWEGSSRETRLLQQIQYPLGPLSGRTRLEQRFFNDEPRTGWRVRQRFGASMPLGKQDDGWALSANVEGFFTLRSGEPGGQTGLTGLRTFVGFEREFERVDVELGYTRQQNIRRGGPDRIGHAPTVALTFKL